MSVTIQALRSRASASSREPGTAQQPVTVSFPNWEEMAAKISSVFAAASARAVRVTASS